MRDGRVASAYGNRRHVVIAFGQMFPTEDVPDSLALRRVGDADLTRFSSDDIVGCFLESGTEVNRGKKRSQKNFIRGNATLHLAVSVGRSVGMSVTS